MAIRSRSSFLLYAFTSARLYLQSLPIFLALSFFRWASSATSSGLRSKMWATSLDLSSYPLIAMCVFLLGRSVCTPKPKKRELHNLTSGTRLKFRTRQNNPVEGDHGFAKVNAIAHCQSGFKKDDEPALDRALGPGIPRFLMSALPGAHRRNMVGF